MKRKRQRRYTYTFYSEFYGLRIICPKINTQDLKDGRSYTKVIKMFKSPKTGAYAFDEKMIPAELVKDYMKQ